MKMVLERETKYLHDKYDEYDTDIYKEVSMNTLKYGNVFVFYNMEWYVYYDCGSIQARCITLPSKWKSSMDFIRTYGKEHDGYHFLGEEYDRLLDVCIDFENPAASYLVYKNKKRRYTDD